MENANENDGTLGPGGPAGPETELGQTESGWKSACRMGGVASFASLQLGGTVAEGRR
jgi:hypothetical protein